ncbi:MAG: hypothetical protein GXP26_01105 [Planctomycetes bacterium]|nr:hypothetical protein [Planctomycetota bacterium]
MSETLEQTVDVQSTGDFPYSIPLELKVDDRDTIRSLMKYPEGPLRDEFALEALKIGVLALRHAAGAIDADLVQQQINQMLETLNSQLTNHAELAHERLTGSLKEYFDPEDGRFSQRVKRLTADDGDLSQLLMGLLDGDDSRLAKTLLAHVGENSPLMKQLSPDQSQGLLAMLKTNVEGQLTQQRVQILREFSLDNPEGALHRLVSEITRKHGDFTKDFQGKIDEVMGEFSLNKEDSALSQLVANVRKSQEKITNEFSLNNKESALHKMKAELNEVLVDHAKTNAQFQEDVKVALGKLITKRETEAQGTRHGLVFEDAVCEFIGRQAQHAGDIAIPSGHTTGLIKNCKVGDCVIELGPDSAAPGAKIAVEAKQDASYTLARAREEIEVARKNRGADWGVFVFSKSTAPAGLEPFQRYGNDIVLIWDAEDSSADVYLKAGLVTARALCFRTERQTEAQQADFETIDRAILEIEKRAGKLDEIGKFAKTIYSASDKILKRVESDRKALDRQVEILRDNLGDLKEIVGSRGS